ncbi:MAG: RIP metalloprotease RseP [Candidatus Omnitrophica bacterium CG11_big_fil_rev_8_21_14_0_20_64_10]|nr:MAG: RIP metalloprotease RseP [Candidatus Omnitrophica bacterium CG11_big_fil_rev_8_21_14_0_20_64_10]
MNLLAVVFTFATIIFVHELGHFLVARRMGVKVEVFSLGFGPRLFNWVRGGTEYRVSWIPLGGFVKMAGEEGVAGAGNPWEFRAKSVGQRIGIALAGPIMNYAFAFVLFAALFMVGGPSITLPLAPQIGQVVPGFPAAEGGILPGDRVLEVNYRPVTRWREVVEAVSAETGEVAFLLRRADQTVTVTLQPRVEEGVDREGKTVRVGRVGIVPKHRFPPHIALVRAAKEVWNLNIMTVQGIAQVVTGRRPMGESFGGPIRIFMWTSQAADLGWIYLFQFIGVISVALGFFNLIPMPVLDGGHILFLAIEGLRGRPLSVRVQEGLTWAGLSLILLLVLTVTYNDILHSGIAEKAAGWARQAAGLFGG